MKEFFKKIWPYIYAVLKSTPVLFIKTKIGRRILAGAIALLLSRFGLAWSVVEIAAFLEKLAPLAPVLKAMTPDAVYKILTGPDYIDDSVHEDLKKIIRGGS